MVFSREQLRVGERVCVAVSGGADSVALLRAMAEANAKEREGLGVGLTAVHVNHGLRGEEAEGDQRFVEELCRGLGVGLRVFRGDVAGRMVAAAEGMEEAAREVRYECFDRLLAEGAAEVVATAHTLDDQAETVMMKLLRGAWTEGLSGVYPVVERRVGRVVRPLLGVRRAEVEAYLRGLGQEWRTDSTNADVGRMRSRVRHELMPRLREFNPAVDEALGQVAELAREEEARWAVELGRMLPQVLLPGKPVRGGGRAVSTVAGAAGVGIELERLRGMDAAMRRRVVRAAARGLGCRISFEETAKVLALCGIGSHANVAGRTGAALHLSGGLRVERSVREVRMFVVG